MEVVRLLCVCVLERERMKEDSKDDALSRLPLFRLDFRSLASYRSEECIEAERLLSIYQCILGGEARERSRERWKRSSVCLKPSWRR